MRSRQEFRDIIEVDVWCEVDDSESVTSDAPSTDAYDSGAGVCLVRSLCCAALHFMSRLTADDMSADRAANYGAQDGQPAVITGHRKVEVSVGTVDGAALGVEVAAYALGDVGVSEHRGETQRPSWVAPHARYQPSRTGLCPQCSCPRRRCACSAQSSG
jgi:hypothetical protein